MMKVLFRLVPVFILSLALALPMSAHALTLSQRLKGRIVLQTEQNGEAWYVRPDNQLRVYMGRPGDAFELMRSLGLGVSNADLKKIPVGILAGELGGRDADDDGIFDGLEEVLGLDFRNSDTDEDGYNDLDELQSGNDPLRSNAKLPIDTKLTTKLSGKILLQVESNGEAWYINPVDSKRYYLGRPNDAFFIMRSLGLGITNIDLAKISEGRIPPLTGWVHPDVAGSEQGVKTYTSSKLGVSFQYLASAGNPVIEEGNTIFVGGKDGQFVKKFTKNTDDSLATAIQKTILSGYSKDKCHVVDFDYMKKGSNDASEITYESTEEIGSGGMCPGDYEHTNGARYFLMDKNHPTSFYFFSIGQYTIAANTADTKDWTSTFKVLK